MSAVYGLHRGALCYGTVISVSTFAVVPWSRFFHCLRFYPIFLLSSNYVCSVNSHNSLDPPCEMLDDFARGTSADGHLFRTRLEPSRLRMLETMHCASRTIPTGWSWWAMTTYGFALCGFCILAMT
ncbi:hypothetical protein DFH11DRAFT_129590 [Phellopilus nigrolimitatus]|nr:hypothetical protein DFH11DRAFT_129590 [Phellopilus nigrolimitatus]